jgi:hypothetical protein
MISVLIIFALGFPMGYANATLALLNEAYPCHHFTATTHNADLQFNVNKETGCGIGAGGCYYQSGITMRPEYWGKWTAYRNDVIIHETAHYLGFKADNPKVNATLTQRYREKYCQVKKK